MPTTSAFLSTLLLLLGSTPAPTSTMPEQDLAKPYADFGFDLLRGLSSSHAQGNVFISPYSIAVSMAMLTNGASGTTRDSIMKTLHSQEQSLDTFNAANAALIDQINKTTAVQLAVANGLWVEKSEGLNEKFEQTLMTIYNAQAQGVDFRDRRTAELINSWVTKHTNGRIQRMLDNTDPSTLVMLTNAIAFKGKWSLPFDAAMTRPKDFKTGTGPRKVPMMNHSAEYSYANDNAVESIRLPYADGSFAMYIVLPHDASAMQSFVQKLTAEQLSMHIASMHARKGTIELPRFTMTYRARLNDVLSKLGMGIAFRNGADFSGIPQQATALRVGDVRHASFLKVDEEGTEAAAATTTAVVAAVMRPTVPPFHMIVDHPFFVAIRDERNGQILFTGIVADPQS